MRAQRRQLGVQLEGSGELPHGLGDVAGREGHPAQEIVPLRRIFAAKKTIHEGLALLHPAVAEKRHPQHVERRPVLRIGVHDRPEQLHHPADLAESEPAVREQEGRSEVLRLRFVEDVELLRGPHDVLGLVVGERQVVADAPVAGRHCEGAPVRLDGLLVAAEGGECGPEVGSGLDARREGEALAVGGHGSFEVAGLVEGDGAGERAAGVLRGRGGGREGAHERHQKEGEPGLHWASLAQGTPPSGPFRAAGWRIRLSVRVPPQKRTSVSAVASRRAFRRPRLHPAGA